MSLEVRQDWKDIVHRCFRCGYCKFTYNYSDFNCPSYKKFRFETYSTGGRLWLIYSIINGDLKWSLNLANVLYACSTCGNCVENCRFVKFNDFLVDIIEAARAEAVKNGFCPENQKALLERTKNTENYNPYGEKNSDNQELKKKYDLPDKAEWVYYIGCTSNYRQQNLRDSTIRFLKKAGIEFTLIDEHCCCSPVIRTGQIDPVEDFMNYNIAQIKNIGATKVITSCAGCYRTIKKDWVKFGATYDFEVYHTIELVKQLLDEDQLKIKSEYKNTVTYHDPCHLGRHVGMYEIPRDVYNEIPGIKLVEMRRNRENAWCCGAGGGVKIGYPEWSVEVSQKRLEEAKETGASVISSICPFCRTNLSDANEKYKMDFEVIDLIEILDKLDIEINK
ncbi:MAG: (Fe-S)-binding protein [Promethearchaeota archaeon]|nr:MAG: (Fe-S)-binding protein [Candidatus Lokiarchaeota archaeon]